MTFSTCIKKRNNIDIVVKCLAFYFIMMPFDSFPMFGMGSLLKLIAFLPLIAIFFLHRYTKLKINKLLLIYMFYILSNFITCFYSVNSDMSFLELKRLLLNSVVIIAVSGIYRNYNVQEVKYLIKALVLGGIATALMTLIFADTSQAGRLSLSVNGVIQDQNYINGYLLFAFAFFINKVIAEKKVIYFLPAVMFVIFTLMTGSRGALLSFAVVILVTFGFYFLNSKRGRFGVIIMATIIVIVGVIGFDSILSLLPSEIAIRFSADYIANYRGTNRSDLWIEILKIFKEGNIFRQLFGYGYGTVPVVNTFNHLVAHNLWIEHLISGGVFGLLALVVMQMTFFKSAYKSKNSIIVASYSGYLAMCMTLSLTNYKPLWNAMIMILIVFNVETPKLKKTEDENVINN